MLQKIFGWMVILLLVSSATYAGPTITWEHVLAGSGVAGFVDETSGDPYPKHRDDEDFMWTHIVNVPPGYVAVTAATLTIRSWNAEGSHDVYFDSGFLVNPNLSGTRLNTSLGTFVGVLQGPDEGWGTSTFDLVQLGLTSLLVEPDGQVEVWIDVGANNDSQRSAVSSSQLTVTFEMPDPEPEPVPAPGALVLGSLGAGVVGWLRRRRNM